MIDEVDADGNSTIDCLKFFSELQGVFNEVDADLVLTPPSWGYFLEFEFAFRKRIFKAINRERQTLMGAFKTAIGDTDFYQDEFLTGFRVLAR